MIQFREEYITSMVDLSGTVEQVFVLISSPTILTADEFNHYFAYSSTEMKLRDKETSKERHFLQ